MTFASAVLIIKYPSKTGKRSVRYEVPAGRSILCVLEELKLHRRDALVAIVNGVTCDTTYILQPGDEVQLLPQIAGG